MSIVVHDIADEGLAYHQPRVLSHLRLIYGDVDVAASELLVIVLCKVAVRQIPGVCPS